MADAIDRLLLSIEIKLHNARTGFKTIDKGLKKIGSTTATLHRKLSFLFESMSMKALGFGLSMLFTGMAIKRFTDTAIRGLYNSFQLVADEQNNGLKGVMALQAAFIFLKFTIFDTFSNTEMFSNFVQFLINMANSISEVVQQNPKLAQMGALFLIIGSAVGGVMMVLGQFTLLAVGLGISLGGLLIILALITLALVILFKIWTSDMTTTQKIIHTVIIVLTTLLAILVLLGVAISLPFILGAIAIGVVIAAFVLLKEKTGGWKNALKALGIFALAIFAAIGDAIYEALILPLRIVIALINAAIKGSNRFLGTNFKTIDQPEFAPLSKKVWEMRNNLLAEADNNKVEDNKEEEKKTNNKLDTVISLLQNSQIVPSTEY